MPQASSPHTHQAPRGGPQATPFPVFTLCSLSSTPQAQPKTPRSINLPTHLMGTVRPPCHSPGLSLPVTLLIPGTAWGTFSNIRFAVPQPNVFPP